MAEAATVGNYVLERELGRGGMGAVYAGVHRLVGRRAAIKVLLPDLSRKQELVERFFNEARAAGRIKHPSIVDIYDFGYATDGSAFIVMELLEGETLAARLKARGPMPIPIATALARQVANALAAAHAAGIVHRDLKPDNVFLVKDPEVVGGERVKLLDFGIAKLATESAGVSATVTGAILGTPHYMSPEQCEGARVVDARTDLYSLGCMLFQMLTGQLPFDSPGIGGLIGMHLHVPPPLLRTRCPNASPELEAVIARLLAKSPDDRFQNAEAVSAALASPSVSTELPAMATLHPSMSGAATAELAMASTMATAGSPTPSPPSPASLAPPITPTSTPPATQNPDTVRRDAQARAATELASHPELMAPHLRPPTLPVDTTTPGPAGKTRPPRGDEPTVPSLPPDMTAPRVRSETDVPAKRGRRVQVMVFVTVVVVALGAFLIVNFNKTATPTDGGGAGTADTYNGSGGGSTGTASGLSYTPPQPDAAELIAKPPPDLDAILAIIHAMRDSLSHKKYADVKAGHDQVMTMIDGCGEPCAVHRSGADQLWMLAQAEASKKALGDVGKKVKAGDCAGARRELEASEDVIDPQVGEELDKKVAGCKPKQSGGGGSGGQSGSGSGSGSGGETGSGAGSGSGTGAGSGSGTETGSGSGSGSGSASGDETVMEAFTKGDYALTLDLCAKKRKLMPRAAAACTVAACQLKKADVALGYYRRLRGPVKQGAARACVSAGVSLDPAK